MEGNLAWHENDCAGPAGFHYLLLVAGLHANRYVFSTRSTAPPRRSPVVHLQK
jgi:hypothetical protein